MNQFFALKIKLPDFDWTFHVTCINLLLMKHKLINFDRIVNNLIVHNLVNKLSELNPYNALFGL